MVNINIQNAGIHQSGEVDVERVTAGHDSSLSPRIPGDSELGRIENFIRKELSSTHTNEFNHAA